MFAKSTRIAAIVALSLVGGAAAALPALADAHTPQHSVQHIVPASTEVGGSLVPGGKALVRTDTFLKGEKVSWELTLGTDVIDASEDLVPEWVDGKASIWVNLSETSVNTAYTFTAIGQTSKKSVTVTITVGEGDGPLPDNYWSASVIDQNDSQVRISVTGLPKDGEYLWELSRGTDLIDAGGDSLNGKGSETLVIATRNLRAGTYELNFAVKGYKSGAKLTFSVDGKGAPREQTPSKNVPGMPKTGN